MRHVPGLPYPLPDRGASYSARVEQGHFDRWLEEISERPPHILTMVELAEEGEWAPTIGDQVRTTTAWSAAHESPALRGRITRLAVTAAGTRLAEVVPLERASLLPVGGMWIPRDDLEDDG